jgi:glycosyltransferase involved in cell wall biosynthesis
MRKQVLLITDELYPVRGAPQIRLRNIIKSLGGRAKLALGGVIDESAPPSAEYELISRPSEKQPIAFILFLLRLGFTAIRRASSNSPAVVLLSVPKYELLLFAPFLKGRGRKLVLDFRDSLGFLDYGAYLSHFFPRGIAKPLGSVIHRFNALLQCRALSSAHVVTVANQGIKDSISHPRVELIPNGVDTELFNPEGKQWFSGGRPLRVAYLGNFAEKDRFEWMAEAGRALPLELHLIGEGRNRSRVVESLNGLSVIEHGAVSHDRLPELLKQIDLGFIFREEEANQSIPVCIFEYSAMNIPTLCNDTGLMARFVGENNLGFVLRSVDELKERLRELVREPGELQRFSHLHETARECFSLKNSERLFNRLFNELLGSQ